MKLYGIIHLQERRRRMDKFEKQFRELCRKSGGHFRYFRTVLFIVYLFRGRL